MRGPQVKNGRSLYLFICPFIPTWYLTVRLSLSTAYTQNSMVKTRRPYWYNETRSLCKVVEMQCEVTDYHLNTNWKQRLKFLVNKVQVLQRLERQRKHRACFLSSPTWWQGNTFFAYHRHISQQAFSTYANAHKVHFPTVLRTGTASDYFSLRGYILIKTQGTSGILANRNRSPFNYGNTAGAKLYSI